MKIPALESWSEMKSFGMGLLETARYKHLGGSIAGYSNLNTSMLNFYRGLVHGLWLEKLTLREKRTILKHYTIIRLDR